MTRHQEYHYGRTIAGTRIRAPGLPRSHVARTLTCAAVLAGSACLPEFEQVQGDRILYEHSAELRACAGNVGYLDAAIVAYETTLGVRAPSPLRYSWLSEADVPRWRYPDERYESLGGEAIGLRAWARGPATVHEVAHLVAGGDNAPPFFQEGLAEALTDETGPRGLRYLEGLRLDPRPDMTASTSRDVDYVLAGVFVNFLLARHGPVKFMRFYRSLVWPFTMARIRATFADAFAVDMDEEVEVFMSGSIPPCDELVFSPTPIECTGANIPWSDDRTWRVLADMHCDGQGVLGGDGDDGTRWRWRNYTVDVRLAGTYRLNIAAPGPSQITFGPCFTCPMSIPETYLVGQEETDVQLEAGTYYVGIIPGSGDPQVQVTLELLDAAESDSEGLRRAGEALRRTH